MPQNLPLCAHCKHLNADASFRCKAFPDGIPEKISFNGAANEHREPYPGDHGIRFEPHPDVLAQILKGKVARHTAEWILGRSQVETG